MASENFDIGKISDSLEIALTANAHIRQISTSHRSKIELQNEGINTLREHAERVENHAAHVEGRMKAKYESSISWKVTSPLRIFTRRVAVPFLKIFKS